MNRENRRLDRERRTVDAMIRIHCRSRHGSREPCPECAELRDYAFLRIDRCPWGSDKPACAKCAVHCYRPDPRERIREVMKFAGPRMMWRHPILALCHVFDGHKPAGLEDLKASRAARRAGP